MQTSKHDIQRAVTDRFIEATKTIPGQKQDLCKKLGIKSTNLNRMAKDPKCYATLQACYNLCHHYGISPMFLLLGFGPMRKK